ncbi:MAG TPA: ATP-binding protein [Pyrinomonadaceae bacterium]|nr:ATP-binding protein [Pyrinomonadaceae bacterium]
MKFQSLTIRARLLWLTFGLAAPLALFGFFNLWEFRQASLAQLNESVERQAQLAATAFEQRVEAQRQTLQTISILAANNESRVALTEYLNSIVKTRPHWLDVQIVGAGGEIVLAQSYKKIDLRAISIENLKSEITRKNSLVIATEQTEDKKLRLLSLALPTAGGGFVVARIDGASVSDVFENLNTPEDNIIAVFDSNNRLIYRSRVSPEQMSLDTSDTPLFAWLNERREQTIEVESPYDRIRRVYGLARIESAGAAIVVGVPSRKLYEPARQRFYRQLFFSLLVTVLAMAAAYAIALGIVRPLRRLTGAARRFGAGDTTARAEITGGGSIGELGTTFNQMAREIAFREEELKTLDRLKSEFVSSVSHELRTPLTTIKTLTRVLQRNKISAAEREEFLATIAEECDRQIDFVQNLLDLSRIESGAYKISRASTDVVKILREAVEAHAKTANARRLKLNLNLPENDLPPALTDAGALRRIVSSLIENAMKYTTENGAIVVAASEKDERIIIEITDSGCGIQPQDLPHIFEKFYRGRPLQTANETTGESFADEDDCANVNETAGIGLGLYLVQNLVEQIGGEIVAESPANNTGRGAKFTVSLPIAG